MKADASRVAVSRFQLLLTFVIGIVAGWAVLAVLLSVFAGSCPQARAKYRTFLVSYLGFQPLSELRYVSAVQKDSRIRVWPPGGRASNALLQRTATGQCSFASGTDAAVFMHIYPSTASAWRMLLDDTVRTIQHSPLAKCDVPVYYSLPGGVQWPYGSVDRTFSPTVRSGLGRGQPQIELQTLASLYEWCTDHPTALAAYIHDKGGRIGPDDVNLFMRQWDWRRLHEYFMLEVPQGCFNALRSGAYDVCGAEKSMKYVPHYSGNFWWARCDHINRLEHPFRYRWEDDPYLSPEFWIGSKIAPERAFNCYNYTGNHYTESYPRSLYVGSRCDIDMLPHQ